jgi:N-hydroxyarylamine O-acetyltransferase
MNIPDYLSRIGYSRSVGVNQETLHGLHITHLRTVPFENLDIGLHQPIQLDEQSLWNKIIARRRGGFCYELNGLFAWLLKEIGFEVTYHNARDYHEENDTFGIDFDHLALLVRVPGHSTHWLADVGYGDNFIYPMNMDNQREQIEVAALPAPEAQTQVSVVKESHSYWLEPFKDGYQLWRRDYDGSRTRQYYFDLTEHSFPSEYEATCLYHQTSPQSIFTQKSIISRLTEDGRISLDSNQLIVTKNGRREVKSITNEERTILLEEHFGVVL